MGKRLDAFLGRGFKTSKFKTMVNLAVSRLAVLKNQRRARCSIARSDVVELLKSSNYDRALLRVEQVIKEQNMLDVFVMLEGYCHLLVERINLIEQHKFCPEELNEAVSTLICAATRCGEFPELQEIRGIFTSRYGKEFASRAIELRNNCGVNPKIIQKLSTRTPSLENKTKVLKEIASDNNIDLPMEEETISDTTMEMKDLGQEKKQSSNPSSGPLSPSGVSNAGENVSMHHEEIERSMRGRKYKDVTDAAQAAFESAAYAAAAARAAVELSRSESTDPDDPNSPNPRPRKLMATIEPIGSRLQTHGEDSFEDEEMKAKIEFEKIHHVPEMKRSFSASSSDSTDGNVDEFGVGEKGQTKIRDLVYDESDGEDEQKTRMESSVNYPAEFAADKGSERIEPLNINRRPISVRTRWTHGR